MVFEKYKVISPKEYAGKKISKQSKSEYPYSRRLNRLQTLDDFEYLVGQLFDKLKKEGNRNCLKYSGRIRGMEIEARIDFSRTRSPCLYTKTEEE